MDIKCGSTREFTRIYSHAVGLKTSFSPKLKPVNNILLELIVESED